MSRSGGPIVHVFNSTVVSGPETLVLPALAVWARAGRRVVIVFLCESRRAEESRRPVEYARGLGLETLEIDVRSRVDRGAVRSLAEKLRMLDPEVAHAHDVKASTYLLRAARKLGRARKFPILSTHHGVRGRSGWRSKLYEAYYTRFVLPGFDRVLAVCTSDGELLRARGVPPSALRVHLNGVDRMEVPAALRAARSHELRQAWDLASHGISAEAVLLGVVGRIAGEKRLDRMLKVVQALEVEAPVKDWAVIVFGGAGARGVELESELRTLAERLGVAKRVLWYGYRSGVGNELAGLDLLLSFSDAEGLPINLVEAGWAGTPVFATRVDGNLDLAPTDAEGCLVPVEWSEVRMAKRLSELIADDSGRARMGLLFQDRVRERFSGGRWLAELARIYEEAKK